VEDDSDRLLEFAESIADGSPLDWDAADAGASASDRELINHLRVLAKLAGLHRSLTPPADAPVPPDTSPEPPPASSLGQWSHLILLERIGTGSYGEVYRARDPQLGRDVALKLLKKPATSLDDTQIANEGRLLALIDHPNVVDVYGVAVADERVGLWMKLIRGTTLAQHLATQGPFSAQEASLIGIDLCGALAEIHKKGLIHRDIKAQNVMRQDGGRIVLMDLGTGRYINRADRVSGDLVGTPMYLAPEIFRGEQASVRSDIYSLGVLLYHLVTNAYPVHAKTVDELQDRLDAGEWVRLRDARPDLPPQFVHVVERAISSDPKRRHASAGALEHDLEQARNVAKAPPHSRVQPAAMPHGAVHSIAVLPFQNLADKQLDYFCDGITEEIINALTTIRHLRVAARDSVFQLKGAAKDVRQVGEILNVEAVLGGSVRASGDRLRIITQLSSAESGHQLWSERFDRTMANVFAVQDEIARSAVRTLQVQLSEGSLMTPPPTTNSEAYRLYLQGRYHWNKRTEEALARSVECFDKALELDADYSQALAGLADAYMTMAVYGARPPHEVMPKARAAARQVSSAEMTPLSFATLACVSGLYDWDWLEAEQLFQHAIAVNPDQSTPHQWYAMNFLLPHGQFADAEAELAIARELDPLSLAGAASAGLHAYYARRYEKAVDGLLRAIELDDHFAFAQFVLGLTHTEMAQYDAATKAFTAAIALSPSSPEILAGMGYSAARAGDADRARAVLNELLSASERRYVSASLVAQIHAGLNDRDAAFVWLTRAVDDHATDLAWMGVRPVFDALRSDDRFGTLSARIGVAPDAWRTARS
jgi:serine/threonine-protein kinase